MEKDGGRGLVDGGDVVLVLCSLGFALHSEAHRMVGSPRLCITDAVPAQRHCHCP